MNHSNQVWNKLRSLWLRPIVKREIDEELRFHLEARTAENIAAGMAPEEAAREARKRFGNVQSVREECREWRGASLGESVLQDLWFGLRMLRRSPGFTAVTVLTLALGMIVNIVVFIFVNEFFFRPLPAQNPRQLVVLATRFPFIEYQVPFSYPDAIDLRRMVEGASGSGSGLAAVFSSLMGYSEQSVHLSRTGEMTERAWVHAVTDNYFSLLGTRPELGRFFRPEEVKAPGGDPVIVLTHATWRNRFRADPSILGQAVKLNGLSFTIVGVARPEFVGASWGESLSGFVPVTMLTKLNGSWALNRGNSTMFAVARLKPGVTERQAQAAMDVAMENLIHSNPGNYLPNTRAVVMSELMSRPSPYISHHVPRIMAALMILALLVLVIAGANVTNLLYARAASREQETAIRSALGATRGRLLRALLTESILLAVGAWLLGVGIAHWLMPRILTMLPTPSNIPPSADTGADWRPFVFGFALSLVAGIAAGLLPALKATGHAIQPLIKRSDTGRGRHFPVRSLLVVGQVAVSCIVLVGAGMALRSIQKLMEMRLGFDPKNLVVASYDLGKQRYDANRGRQFHQNLLERVRALPGVEAATLVNAAPFDTRIGFRGGIVPLGRSSTKRLEEISIPCLGVEQTALSTLRIPLVAGRDLNARDEFGAPLVTVVNQTLADRFWPGEDPIGKRISVQTDTVQVVGVIGPAHYTAVKDQGRPLLFLSMRQFYQGGVTLMVRTTAATAPLVPAIQEIVRQLDPDLPLFNISTLEQQIASSPTGMMPYRIGAAFAAGQGVVALFLAGLGIFGLVSFNVTRRTREIGIRMALGATRAGVMRLVAWESLVLTLAGLVVGMVLSVFLTRLISGLLYEVNPTDGVVFTVVGVIVLAATLLATWLPARRATGINPMSALRSE